MKTTTESIESQELELDTKKERNAFLIFSTVIFAIICAVSLFLFFENKSLSSSIEANNTEIVNYTNSIEKMKNDKKIMAAELVMSNKSEILNSIKRSEAQTYINELMDISRKYKMIFSGFSYENGKITTSAVAIPETVLAKDDGVTKISHLIRDYRTGTGYIFQLSPVLSISGYEQKRSFSIEFNVGNTK
jgi:uncharacterized membrane protein